MTRANTLTEAREIFTRAYIVRTLEKHQWNKTRAASEMGVERPYLYWLIKRYQIERVK